MDLTAWIVSDGTRGMEIQSLALAEALGASAVVKRIRPAPWLRAFPALGAWRAVPPALAGAPLEPPWPDLVIGCGRRNAGAVLGVRARSGGASRAVQIQDPRAARSLFDALVVPAHDPAGQRDRQKDRQQAGKGAGGSNVIRSTGSLNALWAMDIGAEAARLEAMIGHLPRPRVLVAVGGPTRRRAVEAHMAEDFLRNLERLAASGHGLMMTVSRRTPERLRQALAQLAETGPAAILWDGRGDNPYFGFMGAADAIVVTSDSVNMTSEACSTGKGVYVADLLTLPGRLALFQKTVRGRGLTRPFAGEAPPFSCPPLSDAVEVAAALRRRFGFPAG